LTNNLGTQLGVGGCAGDDDARRHRDHQRRNLRHDAIANRQQSVSVRGVTPRQAVLHHAYGQAADDVDHDDEDAGDRIALHELGCAIHGTVEIGFLFDQAATTARLAIIDQPHVHVRIDAHLLAGHAVQGEPRRHLGDTLGTARDHHVLHDHQDEEHHQADDVVAAYHV